VAQVKSKKNKPRKLVAHSKHSIEAHVHTKNQTDMERVVAPTEERWDSIDLRFRKKIPMRTLR
jgi:hypothetical protein